ncbi:MAG TPA: AraC family transcriptional regulator [Stellaceae bacterium]|nr:AraC family transcriptional regulator [Stellaceae bacterium]
MAKRAHSSESDGQRLSAQIEHDSVSEILQVVRFRGMFICRSELAAPWGFRMGARDFANFHIVLTGKACLEVGADRRPLWVSAGDLIVLPHGSEHAMRDSPGSNALPLEELIATAKSYRRGTLRAGGDGATCVLLCGGFTFEEREANPLLAVLPAVIHLRGRRPGVDAWVRSVFDFLKRESAAGLPGAEAVITRLADILFIEALRAYFGSPNADRPSLSAALRDPGIGSVLALLHRHPERHWSLATLSRQTGMSRTALATRFAERVGEPPMRYLTRCRINKAATLLRNNGATVQQAAERGGYDFALGFSRAFKRLLGLSPAEYRRAPRLLRSDDRAPVPGR